MMTNARDVTLQDSLRAAALVAEVASSDFAQANAWLRINAPHAPHGLNFYGGEDLLVLADPVLASLVASNEADFEAGVEWLGGDAVEAGTPSCVRYVRRFGRVSVEVWAPRTLINPLRHAS